MTIKYRKSRVSDMTIFTRNHNPLTKNDINQCELLPGGMSMYRRDDGCLIKLSEDKSSAWVYQSIGNSLAVNEYVDIYDISGL